MGKLKKKILMIILIPILVLVLGGGGVYFYLQTKLKAVGSDSRAEVINAMIKEVITHPLEIKKMMDSVTITDGDVNTYTEDIGASSSSSEMSVPSSRLSSPSVVIKGKDGNVRSSGASINGKAVHNKLSSSALTKNKAIPNNSSIFSIKYMKAHYSDYVLLSTSARNLGGNTYRLSATVRHKPTGKISTVHVTTQLSNRMKETLKKYRK